jgi:hypothetical protein
VPSGFTDESNYTCGILHNADVLWVYYTCDNKKKKSDTLINNDDVDFWGGGGGGGGRFGLGQSSLSCSFSLQLYIFHAVPFSFSLGGGGVHVIIMGQMHVSHRHDSTLTAVRDSTVLHGLAAVEVEPNCFACFCFVLHECLLSARTWQSIRSNSISKMNLSFRFVGGGGRGNTIIYNYAQTHNLKKSFQNYQVFLKACSVSQMQI